MAISVVIQVRVTVKQELLAECFHWPPRSIQNLATELIEGGPEPKRVVILEFANAAAVKRWYHSPEYQKILPGRLDNASGRAFIVEGA